MFQVPDEVFGPEIMAPDGARIEDVHCSNGPAADPTGQAATHYFYFGKLRHGLSGSCRAGRGRIQSGQGTPRISGCFLFRFLLGMS